MGNFYGYHRISTKKQHEDRGVLEIERFIQTYNIELERDVYVDKISGKKFDRPRYTVLKEDILRRGDTLIVTELDRLGRNKQGILKELEYYKEKGVRVIILEVPTTFITLNMDISNPMYKMIFEVVESLIIEVLAVFCQLEIEKKEKRVREGIEAKKLRGEWDDYGRPHAVEWDVFVEKFEQVLAGAVRPFQAIKDLEISTQTYYRYKKRYESERKAG